MKNVLVFRVWKQRMVPSFSGEELIFKEKGIKVELFSYWGQNSSWQNLEAVFIHKQSKLLHEVVQLCKWQIGSKRKKHFIRIGTGLLNNRLS